MIENTERFRVLLLREHDTIRESPRMEKQISKTLYFRGVPKRGLLKLLVEHLHSLKIHPRAHHTHRQDVQHPADAH